MVLRLASLLLVSALIISCNSGDFESKDRSTPRSGDGLEGISNFDVDVWVMDSRSNVYLSEEGLSGFAENRLRRWGVIEKTEEKDHAYLYVVITPFPDAVAFNLDFKRRIMYTSNDTTYSSYGSTWSYSGYAQGPLDEEDVQNTLNTYINYFADEVRKAN